VTCCFSWKLRSFLGLSTICLTPRSARKLRIHILHDCLLVLHSFGRQDPAAQSWPLLKIHVVFTASASYCPHCLPSKNYVVLSPNWARSRRCHCCPRFLNPSSQWPLCSFSWQCPRASHPCLKFRLHSLRAFSSLLVICTWKLKMMHHGRLPDFWIWCRLFMIDCKYSYMDDTRLDDEDDEQGVHARRVVRKQMNTWSMPSNSKGDTCTCNTKRTPRLSNNLHTLSCGGEAMIHQEHTNHSATLQLDMDTTISMNIPARHVESCHESSRPRHYYGPYCCNLCNVMRKSNTPTYIVQNCPTV